MPLYQPLADLLRPLSLDNFVGQQHLVDPSKPIRLMIESKKPYSIIFWGPPGCGKTTLARIIANSVQAQFFQLSAVSAGKKDVKQIIDMISGRTSEKQLYMQEDETEKKYTVLFLDEIHRFNKAQQDFLLPYVENGTIILMGATTENPSFEVISALLSRCRVFVLQPLQEEDLVLLINRGLDVLKLSMDPEAIHYLAGFANGDGRMALNVVEIADQTLPEGERRFITMQFLKEILQKKSLLYDKGGEEHFNTISAFIKSMRASDPNAALYYLARMVEAGEDPLFIARRMVVFASEDIGLAVPTALVVANAVFRACETVGLPECQENLAAGVAYLCQCKKDRSAYDAYMSALGDVKEFGNLPIPMSIRNAPTKLMKDLEYGKDYEMYGTKSLLPDKLKGKKYFKNT
jgi:putative ATPase